MTNLLLKSLENLWQENEELPNVASVFRRVQENDHA